MQSLGKISQKKSIIYFSNGITQSGVDNQSALRAATAAAVKANVSIYPLDVRGLQAFPPGGEAQNASLHGQSAYNGTAIFNDLNGNANSQETLSTLADDTGGKAFFDSNDFSGVFAQVQKDTSAYYVLGFTSTNPAKDGRFRHLKVALNRSDVKDIKLEYRSGYYAGRDFQHLNRTDREQQLDDELDAQLPQTDVAVYAGAHYFRQDDSHYYLGVSLVIPGSQIPFTQAKDKDNATIDVIGEALANGKLPVGHQRDTVKLALDSAQQVRRKNVQYNTGFVLAPGEYHLKFIVRENQSGRMGSFETDVTIPDLRKAPLRMSSVVLANQRVPATGASTKKGLHPLVQNQQELVPNITHVFTQDQHLYLQYEVYDAAHQRKGGTVAASSGNKARSTRSSELTPARREWRCCRGTETEARERRRPRPDKHRIPARKRKSLRIKTNRRERSDRTRPQSRHLPDRLAAAIPEARLLHLPGQRHRRQRRQLRLPPLAHPGEGNATRNAAIRSVHNAIRQLTFVGAGFTPPGVNTTSIDPRSVAPASCRRFSIRSLPTRPELPSPHETPNSPPAHHNKSRTAATLP